MCKNTAMILQQNYCLPQFRLIRSILKSTCPHICKTKSVQTAISGNEGNWGGGRRVVQINTHAFFLHTDFLEVLGKVDLFSFLHERQSLKDGKMKYFR